VGRGVCVDACVGKAAVGEEDRGPQRALCDVWGGLAVGMFTDSYRPRLSGVVHSVASVARALREQGHRVVVFAPRHPDYQDQEPDVVRLPALSNRRHPDFPLLLPVVRGLDRLVNELGLQVVHTHSPFTAGRLAEASRGPRPLVFTHHTLYEEYVHYAPLVPRSWARRWVRGRVVRFCNRCDLVVAPTGAVRDLLRSRGVRSRVEVVPTAALDLEAVDRVPAADPGSAGVPDGAPLVVCAGRMAPEKSMDTVLQAFAATPALREAYLVMVGGGPSLERLRRLAEDLDVASRVRFTGPLPWQQVVGWMKAAHVFVFASRTETQGLVVVEAMACGLPVVAVRAGGVAEVVEHGRTGLLVDPDPEQLGAAAARVLADGHLRRSLGEQARRRAEGFSAPRVAAQLVELYRSVLAGR